MNIVSNLCDLSQIGLNLKGAINQFEKLKNKKKSKEINEIRKEIY